MMKKTAVAFIIILSLVLLFSACSGGETIDEPEDLEYDIIIDELIDRVAVVAVRIDRFSGKSK